MPLIPTRELIDLTPVGSGVAAFNVIQLEHAEAIVAGAAMADRGVILQISENAVAYHGALAPIALASLAVAEAAKVPVAVHLDHATNPALVREAVALGLGSVMFDASKRDYADNVQSTAEIVRHCHEHAVFVEAELGEVGGKDGVHAPGVRTDPADAAAYVRDTGVDALAVAVGTSHAMLTRDASLDFDLIAALHTAVPVPLVLHGSSGVSDRDLTRAVSQGMAKINIATHLNGVLTTAVRDVLSNEPALVDPRKYLGAGRLAVSHEVARLIRVIAP